MKFILINMSVFAVLVTMLSVLPGCFREGSKENPEIKNLVYIPLAAPVEEGKATPIIGTFNILRERGESASITAAAFDPSGRQVATETLPLGDQSLKVATTLGFGFDMPVSKKGDYLFQVFLTDSSGRQSNRLNGTFAVSDLF
jgi:hypothetical protein